MDALVIARLSLAIAGRDERIVDDVTLSVARGEVVALVGESGCGKTSLGLAALGRIGGGLAVAGGTVNVGDASLLELGDDDLRRVRGARISYLAQEPAAALNPALRIGAQLAAVLDAHHLKRRTADDGDRVADVLQEVSLAATADLLQRYPHQLSGGQLQRVALAMALVCDPDVIVLDEPTTGLDTVTRSLVFATIRRRRTERGLAVLCISHELAVVADVADRLYVMYSGSIVEQGPTAAVLADPAHPYTRHLLAAMPDPSGERPMLGLPGLAPDPRRRPPGCQFAPRCDLARDECVQAPPALADLGAGRRARCVSPFAVPRRLRTPSAVAPASAVRREVIVGLRHVTASYGGFDAVRDATLDVERGEWIAIVGPSGAGKTTLVRAIAGLHRERTGRIELAGEPLAASARQRTLAQRRSIQMVLQHPYASFNGRRTVGQAIGRALRLTGAPRAQARVGAGAMLERVGLHPDVSHRYPGELSGGELQRAAIARALAGSPEVLLCDEITSSLDSVVQAAIIELLAAIHEELGLTIVFVTHDLALVAAVTDRTAVMADGSLVEVDRTRQLFDAPRHRQTRALLDEVRDVARTAPTRGVFSSHGRS